MTNTAHKTIEDYGMRRVEVPCHVAEVTFMAPFLQDYFPLDWESNVILLPKSRVGDREAGLQINTYAVSVSEHAYATLFVKLTKQEEIGSERLTEMNYRDMLVDNFRAAGGDTTKLRILGVSMILNKASRASIEKVFKAAGKNILFRGLIEITPDDNPGEFRECATNNPFVRGQCSLLKHRADDIGNAFIDRLFLLSEGYERRPRHNGGIPFGEPRLHMVTVLGRHS